MKSEKKTTLRPVVNKKSVSANWIQFMKNSNNRNGEVVSLKVHNNITVKPSVKPSLKRKPKQIGKKDSKVVALDCEMVADEQNQDMLARVSIVDFRLDCIYDKYVKPTAPVADYRTKVSGIRPEDVENGEEFDVVQKEVRALLYNKLLVGHALQNDFRALKLRHHFKLIRDTSQYKLFKEASDNKRPALKTLAKHFLDETIQEGEHNSVEDAKTAMKLYKKYRKEWEKSFIKPKVNLQECHSL